MSRWEAWSFHCLTLVVTATGIVYLWMKYGLETNDPFAVVNHPLQPVTLMAHLLAAPFLILITGMILNSHVLRKVRNGGGKVNRISGWLGLALFPVMVLSGYLLQVTSAPALARTFFISHLVSGFVFAAAYGTHIVVCVVALRKSVPAQQGCRAI